MKFGLRNTSFVYPNGTGQIREDTKTHIQRAEQDGFHSFWVMDHFYQLPVHGSQEEPFLDAWTVLPALAAVTNRIRIGAMVSPVGYRNPALLARMAASLDHISGGRMNFGFGAGGFKPEYRSYGFEFTERPSIRLAQMQEALQLILGLWTHPRFTFHGYYFHVEDVILEPKPLQKPHPPILIGGVGPKLTLRIIAELGDACNLCGDHPMNLSGKEILSSVTAKKLVGMNQQLKKPPTIWSSAGGQRKSCKQKLSGSCQKESSHGWHWLARPHS